MTEWSAKLDEYLKLAGRDVLRGAGAATHEAAIEQAQRELDAFATARANLPSAVEAHFDEAVRDVEAIAKRRPRGRRKADQTGSK